MRHHPRAHGVVDSEQLALEHLAAQLREHPCERQAAEREQRQPPRPAHDGASAFRMADSRSWVPPTPVYTTLPARSSTTTYDVAGASYAPLASPRRSNTCGHASWWFATYAFTRAGDWLTETAAPTKATRVPYLAYIAFTVGS